MNKKSEVFEKMVVRLFLTEKMNRSEICRTLKCSMFAVNRILNDHKIDPDRNTISQYDKRYGEILEYLNAANNLCATLKKFNRHKHIVYDICNAKNMKADDDLIINLFITVDSVNQTKCIAKPTINYFADHCNDNNFLRRVMDYLKSRYPDSESISETIARIYNKLDTRPVCKQCGKQLTYYSLNEPFPIFCSKACSNNNEDTKLHLKQTCLKKYGVTNSAKVESVKRKYIDRMEQKYGNGITNAFQADAVIKKSEATKLSRYGSKTYNNRVKAEHTCLEMYGVKIVSQNEQVRKKQQYRYSYRGISFDSAPEIAFYVWLNDVKNILGIDFEYAPNVKFEYEHNGRQHFYMPDFRIGNEYIEIKGDHFFKDGKMILPYRKKEWSDETYQKICDQYEAKHQCMLRNGILIIKNAEYKFFVSYVEETYGKTFLRQCKNTKIVNI